MPLNATDLWTSPPGLPHHWTRWGAVVVAAVAALLLSGCGADLPGRRPPVVPDRVERFGELELVTHTRAERGGDAARFAWMHTQHWSMRWKGKPLEVQTLTGLWGDKPLITAHLHSVFVIERPGAALPDLLVLVGDPNNTAAFHRVSPAAESSSAGPDAELLCIVSGGANDVAWAPILPAGAPSGEQTVAAATQAPEASTSRRWSGPTLQRLQPQAEGPMRLLRLGEHCVYDPLGRQVRVTPPAPERLTLITAYGPTLLSPDGQALARLAFLDGQPHLPVVAFTALLRLPQGVVPGSVPAYQWLKQHSHRWQQRPVDRSRMRVPRLDQIDGAWMAHHWQWQAQQVSGEETTWVWRERSGFRRLPHRGWYYQGADQYSLDGIVAGGILTLAQAVRAELGGEIRPGPARPGNLPPIPLLRVDGIDVSLSEGSFYISAPVRLVAGDPLSNPAARQALIHRIGDAVDRLLASGRYDMLFDFAH
jgi:hypothetical protein